LATCCHARRVSRRFTYHLVGPGEQRRGHVEAKGFRGLQVDDQREFGRRLASNTHDFNGDGFSDILWRNTNGGVVLRLMNNGSILSSLGVGSATSDWSIVGQREFNGDGLSDILWRNSSGGVALWLMNGATIAS
jgi:hypothetical protein